MLPAGVCEPLERDYEAMLKAMNKLLGAIDEFE